MSIFYPDFSFHRIYDISVDFFKKQGITTLLLDVDNTLTTDNNPEPNAQVMLWLQLQRDAGMRLMLLSNNYRRRVEPFAQRLGLEYIAMAKKPLPWALKKALRQMGVPLSQAAVIGDQLFTDILCGRMAHCTTILVELMEPESGHLYRLKRRLERPILARYHKQL